MSHQFFFQSHIDGEDQEFPVTDLMACFSPFVFETDDDSFVVRFSDTDDCRVYVTTTRPTASHFMVDRPCADPRLDECIFNALRLGNFVSFEPGFDCAFVFDESTVKHLPSGMREDIPEIKVIHTVEEYRRR